MKMTIHEVRKAIITDNLDEIPFSVLSDIMARPAEYELTWGELMRVVNAFTALSEKVNDAIPKTQDDKYQKKVNAELRKKIRELYSKVDELNTKMCRLGRVFNNEEEDI